MTHRLPILWALLVAIATSIIAFALMPQMWLNQTVLNGADFLRADAARDLRPHRLGAEIADDRTTEFQQIRTILNRGADPEATLILIDANEAARTFLNNIQARPVEPLGTAGDPFMQITLPDALWQAGLNTLDIIYPTTVTHLRPPIALIMTSNDSLSDIRLYVRLNQLARVAISVAGLFATIMCFLIIALAKQKNEKRWPLAAQTLLLTIAAAPSLTLSVLPVPTIIIAAFAAVCAILSAIISIILARKPTSPSLISSKEVVGVVLPIAAGACLFTGLSGTVWAPAFAFWPIAVSALGVSLTLVHFGLINVALIWTAIHLVSSVIERIRQREILIGNQQEMLAQQSQSLEAEVHERAILEERERFSRDIHDGLGGSLLSLLVQVRAGKVKPHEFEDALEANLDELRMMIDSLDQSEQSLNAALSTFQARIRSMFGSVGIELDWSQPDIQLPERASPDFILHLYRILQETGSNIIRHSNATHAEYRFSWDELNQQILVVVADNGSAQEQTLDNTTGNGLRNMARRVEQMRGVFHAGPRPEGGWAISISLPI